MRDVDDFHPGDPAFLWYVNPTDGEAPWEAQQRVTPSFDVIRHQARTLDRLGFYGALTTAREPISLIGDSRRDINSFRRTLAHGAEHLSFTSIARSGTDRKSVV